METICFDLDGTLCTNTFGEYESAEPFPWAIERVRRLAAAGHRIVILTARGTATGIDWEEVTLAQLERWAVPYDELRFGKPSADVYVDDRGVHTDAWRRGDAIAAPGLDGLEDGEPAVPRVPPPHVTSVVEVARTFAGRPLRLAEHAERSLTLAQAAGIVAVPSAAAIESLVRASLPPDPFDDELVVAICVAAAGHQAFADVWEPGADTAEVRVSCRPLREAAAGLRRFAAGAVTPGEIAIEAALDGASHGWPLWLEGELATVRDARVALAPSPGPPTVARLWVLELCAALGIPAVEAPITAAELEDAEEAFVVGLPFCVLPITAVDGRPVGAGAPGFFTRNLLGAWGRDAGVDIAAQTALLADSGEVAVP